MSIKAKLTALASLVDRSVASFAAATLVLAFLTLCFGLLTSKAIALYGDPGDMSLYGSCANFLALASMACGGFAVLPAAANATRSGNPTQALMSVSLLAAGIFAVLSPLALLSFAPMFSDFRAAFLFALLAPLCAINGACSQLLSYQTSKTTFYALSAANISLPSLATIAGFTWGSISLALTLNAAVQVALCAVAVSAALHLPNAGPFSWREAARDAKKLLAFLSAAISSSLIGNGTQILGRQTATSQSMQSADLWQAASKISDIWFSSISMFINAWMLPKLAATQGKTLLSLSLKGAFFIGGSVSTIGLLAYLTSHWWIPIIYSSDYVDMRGMLAVNLTADIFKGMAWVFTHALLARGRSGLLILVDAIYLVAYALGIVCLKIFGANLPIDSGWLASPFLIAYGGTLGMAWLCLSISERKLPADS